MSFRALIFKKVFRRPIPQGKADDHTMHRCPTTRFTRPAEGAMRKIDDNAARPQIRP